MITISFYWSIEKTSGKFNKTLDYGLNSLNDGVLGQLTRKKQLDGGPNFLRDNDRLLVDPFILIRSDILKSTASSVHV